MSDIVEFVLTKDVEEYVIVSSGVAGGPGPRGERGPSATPGVEISDPYVTATGHVAFDIITHYGITAAGQPYYVSNPAEIPPGEEAYLDVDTLTLLRGGPGTDREVSALNPRGDWVRNTQYDVNDLFRYNNRIYRVLSPFRSGASFDATNVQLFLGSPEATGVTYLGDLNTQIHQDQVGRYVIYASPLTAERNLVLSRFRSSSDQSQLVDEGAEYVIVRRSEALGASALVVRGGDTQGAANELARLQPGNWVQVKYDRNAWLVVAAGSLSSQGAYNKPPTGIPSTDLSSDVRGRLDLAASALQSVSLRVTAGPPTDAPEDGQLPTIDKNNNRLYVRVNGTWRYIALQGP